MPVTVPCLIGEGVALAASSTRSVDGHVTAPTACAGVVAVIWVAETTV